MFLTFKLFTCCIDGFNLGMKSQSIVYLLIRNAHIYWNLDLESEMHLIWGLISNDLKNARAMFSSRLGGTCNNYQSGLEISLEGCPSPDLTPMEVHEGVFNILLYQSLCTKTPTLVRPSPCGNLRPTCTLLPSPRS